MSALFCWNEAARKPRPAVGDKRVVVRFLLWPRKLGGQWRWFGFERIHQEFQRYRVCPPEMPAMDVVGWRSVAWGSPTSKVPCIRFSNGEWHCGRGFGPTPLAAYYSYWCWKAGDWTGWYGISE